VLRILTNLGDENGPLKRFFFKMEIRVIAVQPLEENIRKN